MCFGPVLQLLALMFGTSSHSYLNWAWTHLSQIDTATMHHALLACMDAQQCTSHCCPPCCIVMHTCISNKSPANMKHAALIKTRSTVVYVAASKTCSAPAVPWEGSKD